MGVVNPGSWELPTPAPVQRAVTWGTSRFIGAVAGGPMSRRPGWSSQLLEAPKRTGSWAPRDPEWQGRAGRVISVDERDGDIPEGGKDSSIAHSPPPKSPPHPMPSHHPSSLSVFLLGFPGAPPEFKGHAGSIRWGVAIVEAQGPLEGQQGAVMLQIIPSRADELGPQNAPSIYRVPP